MKSFPRILLVMLPLALLACSDDSTGPGGGFAPFSDDFGDGTIDPAIWEHGGKIAEVPGTLQLRRTDERDFITAKTSLVSNWHLTMRIRLNAIEWQDNFHGLSLRAVSGEGISFGFTKHGKLFIASHNDHGGTSYSYGPDGSNRPGIWQNWTFVRDRGKLTILVDDVPISWQNTDEIPLRTALSLPGMYTDGDGAAGTGTTSSDVDYINVE